MGFFPSRRVAWYDAAVEGIGRLEVRDRKIAEIRCGVKDLDAEDA